jgi:two-component system phosphate regulon sensor histidine kinase PhoR
VTFRTRTFVGVFVAASLALAVSTLLIERAMRDYLRRDIERGLMSETRLAAALLAHRGALTDPDGDADALGRIVGGRVTFIAADGRVLGDSAVDAAQIASIENHGAREEVVEARRAGEGSATRRSATTTVETLYVAVAVPDSPMAVVRLALPLTVIEDRIGRVRGLALVGLGAGLVAALVLIWAASLVINRRIAAVADAAARYRAGDFSRPARDHGADEVGVVANVLDDTARELGARLTEMARERAHTDAILTGMAEGVLLVTAAGRLVLTNPAGRAMLRLPETPGDRHYLELVRQPDVAALVARALAGESPASIEVELDPGSRQTFIAHVVPVDAVRGGGAVLVLRDITDLRRADQVRRDFVANVSHELRTPLTAIRGYVEALLDGPIQAPQTREFLEIVDRQSLRMDRLVRDLLRLARLDAGQETLTLGDCRLVDVIGAVTSDLDTTLRARGQTVQVALAADAAVVRADPAKLSDALRNLVENASNYSPQDGQIEVATTRDQDCVILRVADRGPGIPEADLPRIFERFYRVDRSRTRDPGGTGLGLSIVKHLIELLGGRVTAANREGGGAVFELSLPAPSGPPA